MAAASIPGDVADSRHLIARASGGKYGGGESDFERGGLEGDQRGDELDLSRAVSGIAYRRLARTDPVTRLLFAAKASRHFAQKFILFLPSRFQCPREDLLKMIAVVHGGV